METRIITSRLQQAVWTDPDWMAWKGQLSLSTQGLCLHHLWPGAIVRCLTTNWLLIYKEESIPRLLAQCTHDRANGGSWYFRLSSHRARSKEVLFLWWKLIYLKSGSSGSDNSLDAGGLQLSSEANAVAWSTENRLCRRFAWDAQCWGTGYYLWRPIWRQG